MIMRQNIYNVPEGFFDKMQAEALSNASRIRSRRKTALIASSGSLAAVVAILLVLPVFRTQSAVQPPDNMYADIFESNEEFVDFYECDIFLNNL